jgi:hypothetical protein
MAVATVKTAILRGGDSERGEGHGRCQHQGDSNVLAHGELPWVVEVDLLVSI